MPVEKYAHADQILGSLTEFPLEVWGLPGFGTANPN
jgi:hypothetical protein